MICSQINQLETEKDGGAIIVNNGMDTAETTKLDRRWDAKFLIRIRSEWPTQTLYQP